MAVGWSIRLVVDSNGCWSAYIACDLPKWPVVDFIVGGRSKWLVVGLNVCRSTYIAGGRLKCLSVDLYS
jgi:hypothetical protein